MTSLPRRTRRASGAAEDASKTRPHGIPGLVDVPDTLEP